MKAIAKPIDVIAWFNKDGTPKPIKFRITSEDENEAVIKIDKVLFNYTEKLAGNPMLVFRCQGVVNNMEKIFELKYELGTCKWMLFKI